MAGFDEFESENAVVFGCFDIHDKLICSAELSMKRKVL